MDSITLNIEQFNTLVQEVQNLKHMVCMLNEKLDRTHYTPAQAAKEWNKSRSTVDRWIKSGKVRTIDAPGHPKISIQEIIRVKNELL